MWTRQIVISGFAVTVVAVLPMLGAVPASAGLVGGGGKPTPREFAESGLPATFEAGMACDFAVTVAEVVNKEFRRTFPNGNSLITGRLVVRVTNDVTDETVVRNVSGPVLLTTGHAGEQVAVLSGSSISPVFQGNDLTGEVGRGLFVFHGPTVFTDFKLTDVSGNFEDLCETLAAT
jgi:hypothetical protein